MQSPFGFHLIEVLERRMQMSPMSASAWQPSRFCGNANFDAYQDWLRQIRDAYVEYRIEEQ